MSSNEVWEKTGVRVTPEEVAALSCHECGSLLVRSKNFWVCGRGHGRLIEDTQLLLALVGMRYDDDHSEEWLQREFKRRAASFLASHGLGPAGLLRRLARGIRMARRRLQSA